MTSGPRHRPIEVALRCDLPVGVVRWEGSPPRLTVIVKASMALEGGRVWLSAQQAPLSLDRDDPLSPHELLEATDFAPYKPRADLLVTGSAHADRPAWAIPITVAVGSLRRELFACTSEPRASIPLSEPYLRAGTGPGAASARIGPRSPRSPERSALAAEPFDWGFFNAAPPEQQLESIPEGAEITLEGLLRSASHLTARLPAMRPRVHVFDGDRLVAPVALFCDTLVIDADRAICSLTWRGVSDLAGVARPSLLVTCGTTTSAEPTLAELEADRAGATWTVAAEAPEHEHESAAVDDEDEREDEDEDDANTQTEPPPAPAPVIRLGATFRLGAPRPTQVTLITDEAARSPEPDLLPFARAPHPIAPPPLLPIDPRPAATPPPLMTARPITEPPPPLMTARPITERPPSMLLGARPLGAASSEAPAPRAAPTEAPIAAERPAAPGDPALERYASIQAAVWSGGTLSDVLTEHGLDEHTYRVGLAELMRELTAEARAGRHDRLLRLSAEVRRRAVTTSEDRREHHHG